MRALTPLHLKGLTDEQTAATIHKDGPGVTVAGAGAGKTSVLVKRVAHLIHSGVPPGDIVLTTFSKAAGEQLKDRLRNIVGQKADDVHISTLHSLGFKLLRDRGLIPQRDDGKLIMKRWQQGKFVRDYYYTKQQKVTPRVADSIIQRIAASKRQLLTPDQIKDDEEFRRLWTRYEEWKEEQSVIEFDDMVWMVCTKLDKDQSIAQQFKYILVDEFQDVDQPQLRMIELLAAETNNVFVVGDGRQSIYAFRGSDEKVWEKFLARWPDSKVYILTRNFRSLPYIVATGNKIAQHIELPERVRSEMQHVREGLGQIRTHDSLDSFFEALTKAHDEGIPWKEMAVVARINSALAKYERMLREEKIPYRISSKDSIFRRREVQTVFALARVLEDHRDSDALEEFLRSKHPWTMWLPNHYIDALMAEVHDDPVLALGQEFGHGGTGARSAQTAQKAKNFILNYDRMVRGQDLQARLRLIVNSPEMRTMIETIVADMPDQDRGTKNFEEEVRSRLQTVKELVELSHGYTHAADMQEDLTSSVKDDDEDAGEDAVWLSSIHRAKGLEWDVVFIADCTEGKLPRDVPDPERPEEIRIAFVAATRARDRLHLVHDNGELSVLFAETLL